MRPSNAAKNQLEKIKAFYTRTFDQGCSLINAGKFSEAVKIFQSLLELHRDDAGVWGNLGYVLYKLDHYSSAITCLKRSIDLNPHSVVVLRNYAACLQELCRKEEAFKAYETCLKMAPNDASLYISYCVALSRFGEFDKALKQAENAFNLDPEHREALWHQTDIRLRLGKWNDAWKDFEIRWEQGKNTQSKQQAEKEKTYKSERWTGQNLRHKTIMIYPEQGAGDSILCSRYIPMVKAHGTRVILGCTADLRRLFQGIPGVDKLVDRYDFNNEHIDYHIPMMSLPGIFKTALETIPPPAPLFVPPAPPDATEKLLGLGKDRFRVGIVWSGSSTYPDNKYRSVALKRFLPLAEI